MGLTITPKIFKPHAEVRAAMTLRGRSDAPFGFNLSASVGDDPDRVKKNREKVASGLGFEPERLATQKQVHGDRIVRVDELYTAGESDALITDLPGTLLAVSVADCVPVLLYSPEGNVVAGIHSGWRGTVRNIAPRTVHRLYEEYGVAPAGLKAWIGPAAGECCYEVGAEVAEQFDATHSRAVGAGKYLLDTRGAVLRGLIDAGVPPDGIEVDVRCTICDERFHSYRRDADRSGRMFAMIGIVE